MRSGIILSLLLFGVLSCNIIAQDMNSRVELQHHLIFYKSHLPQAEQMLSKNFESNDQGIVSSSIQTFRQLEQLLPDEKFAELLNPLINIMRNENESTEVRMLTAMALDELHSDKGDAAIYDMAKNSSNKAIRDICKSLAIESLKNDMIVQSSLIKN